MLRPSRAFARGEMEDLCPSIVRPMTDWCEADLDGEVLYLRLEESEHIMRVSMLWAQYRKICNNN